MKLLTILTCILISSISYAQNVIRGVIYLKNDNNPIPGVIIRESGTDNYSTSNTNGEFSICITSENPELILSGLGLQDCKIQPSDKTNLGRIYMNSSQYTLPDAIVTSSFVVEGLTPISASTITGADLEQKMGNHELVEALKTTPGVHPNRQGGGWGDSEIYMRGFDNSNIAVLVNGIPINDMETGSVYWSDWANLSDVSATIQTQRGIGTSRVSTPSVGGTINITTKGIYASSGGTASISLGSHGFNKVSFSVNSGLSERGWAFSLLGSRTAGDGYFQGGDFEMFSYFVNLTKLFGKDHQLVFTGFGAPQKHYSRSNALTASEWEKICSLYALKDWREYNPDYGFNSSGQRKTADYTEYHKPFLSLAHNWNINEQSKLNTTIYMAFGRGGSYSGKADEINYSEYDWYATDYGLLNMKFRASDGTYDYSMIENINANSQTGSQLIMTQIDALQNTYGFSSTYSNQLGNLNISAGLEGKYFKSAHTNRLIDLLGGNYYIDPCRQEVSIDNNSYATAEWRDEKLLVGNVVYRDYDSHVAQAGAFAHFEYRSKSYSAFISSSVSNTTYWKVDRFYHDSNNARSGNANYWSGTIKGGFNYIINPHNNVYFNAGFISRAPQFKSGAFMSATSSNVINTMAKNEKSATAEVGYSFHNEYISVNANAYYTEWIDKSMTKKGKITEQYYINMTGVDSRHMGFELELKARPTNWVEVGAMLSIGDWEWDSDKVKGYAYNLSGNAITSEGKLTTPGAEDHAWAVINMKGIKVGGSAQTTAALDVAFSPFEDFKIGGTYTFYDRNFAYYSISGSSLKLGQELFVSDPWKIPSYGCFDLRASCQFPVGKQRMTIFCNINNVFDSTYIEKAWNPSNVSKSLEQVDPEGVYMFYALGRNWSAGIKLNF